MYSHISKIDLYGAIKWLLWICYDFKFLSELDFNVPQNKIYWFLYTGKCLLWLFIFNICRTLTRTAHFSIKYKCVDFKSCFLTHGPLCPCQIPGNILDLDESMKFSNNSRVKSEGNCINLEQHHHKQREGRHKKPQGNSLSCSKEHRVLWLKRKNLGGKAYTDTGSATTGLKNNASCSARWYLPNVFPSF